MAQEVGILTEIFEELIPNPKKRRYIRRRENAWLDKLCEYKMFRHWKSRQTPTRTPRGFYKHD